jgi:hypothetical protein
LPGAAPLPPAARTAAAPSPTPLADRIIEGVEGMFGLSFR